MRALIASSPTLDEIVLEHLRLKTNAPGGPGLFAGLALRRLGYEVCNVGYYGPDLVESVRTEESIGVKRVCCIGQEGLKIRHIYDPNGTRKTTIISKPRPLTLSDLDKSLKTCGPDLVIVSPNYDEVPLDLLMAFRSRWPVSLDAQGYFRSQQGEWLRRIPEGVVKLIHMSDDDGPMDVARQLAKRFEAVLYTVGPGGAVIFSGGLATAIPSRGPRLDDRTGAGDVITALVSHYYLVARLPLEDAYEASLELFPLIMEEAARVRKRAFIGYPGPATR
ncbi:MAG: hypothetical protein ACP5HK_01300 [Acidilobus sp.]